SFRHSDDQVGFAELPAFVELRGQRQILRITFRRAGVYPLLNEPDLLIAQPALADEFGVTRFRQPGRHIAAARDSGNLLRAFSDIRKADQAERPRTARMMAGSAIFKDDRSDVFIEGGFEG